MTAEVFVLAVKDRELQRVDHAAYSVNDPSGEEPPECCRGHIVQDLCKCQNTGPSHPDIEDGGDPFWTVYPEGFDQDACDRDRPYDREKDDAGPAL